MVSMNAWSQIRTTNHEQQITPLESYDMVKPISHKQIIKENVLAMFERSASVVNIPNLICAHVPNKNGEPVLRFAYPDRKNSFHHGVCQRMLNQYRQGTAFHANNVEDVNERNHLFVKCCVVGAQPPPTKHIIGPSLCSGAVASIEAKPALT